MTLQSVGKALNLLLSCTLSQVAVVVNFSLSLNGLNSIHFRILVILSRGEKSFLISMMIRNLVKVFYD